MLRYIALCYNYVKTYHYSLYYCQNALGMFPVAHRKMQAIKRKTDFFSPFRHITLATLYRSELIFIGDYLRAIRQVPKVS